MEACSTTLSLKAGAPSPDSRKGRPALRPPLPGKCNLLWSSFRSTMCFWAQKDNRRTRSESSLGLREDCAKEFFWDIGVAFGTSG